ncbi:MAG: DUF3047 domain-containing protein [Acidimicrobiales bacterium]
MTPLRPLASPWIPHPALGDTSMFAVTSERPNEIRCSTHKNVGIVCYPVDVPLGDDVTVEWSWQVDALPSAVREDSIPTHDYLSVAVEFDDGHDLTWMWSTELDIGTAFTCPLPWWDERETHLVIRSGTAGLGVWHHERRHVARDIATALPMRSPERIVALWLIANSILQQGSGECRYRDIALVGHHGRTPVLPEAERSA